MNTQLLKNIPENPEITEDLYLAAGSKELVPFIGAGVSKLAGYPDWKDFADRTLLYFVEKGELTHAQYDQISSLSPRVKLSVAIDLEEKLNLPINFEKILQPPNEKQREDIYKHVLGLSHFSKSFVTTNYDKELDALSPASNLAPNGKGETKGKTIPQPSCIYKPNEITVDCLYKENSVIHIHGSVRDRKSMVLTTADYLTRYSGHQYDGYENPYLTFLQELFNQRTVLFVGYGLEEMEILEHIIQKGINKQQDGGQKKARTHYVLQGFFSHQIEMARSLQGYFQSFGISLVTFSLDTHGWSGLVNVIKHLNKELPPGRGLTLTEKNEMAELLTTTSGSKELAFVNLMKKDDHKAATGFRLLIEQAPKPLDKYYDLLHEKELIIPDGNQGIIPSWPALEYLEEVAKISDQSNKPELAEKVMDIVRSVSKKGEAEIRKRKNHYVCYMFAKIIGSVPSSTFKMEDIDLLPTWLDNELLSGAIAKEINEGILSRSLNENSAPSLKVACRILDHCTTVKWESEYGMSDKFLKPVTAIEDYWLGELLKRHIAAFGEKTAKETAKIFTARLKEISNTKKTKRPYDYSYILRPAIEKHAQNRRHKGPVDHFVDGLRDVLSQWVEREPEEARYFVKELMNEEAGIIRRIVIHTLNHHWSVLNEMYLAMLSVDLLQPEYLHEMYELLSARFAEMTDEQKRSTLDMIRDLSAPDNIEEEVREQWLKSEQRQWLSAIANKGDASVDKWYAELNADESIGKLSSHPNFSFYSEAGFLHDTSPHTVQELLYFAENGTLVNQLNEFKETNSWRGPTKYGLANTLADAVKEAPNVFINNISKFVKADYAYQYGIINGFKQLWDTHTKDQHKDIDWDEAWEKLIGYFETILNDEDIWQKTEGEGFHRTPTRNWIPPIIAEFLNAGTRVDNYSYPPKLLSRTRELITLMLENVEPDAEAHEDAIDQAINSAKGKVIEALFIHTLRECRVKDKDVEEHHTIWSELRPIFDKELNKCKGTNFEFSALAGNYLIFLDYISHEWLQKNIQRIFPEEHTENFLCALNGLIYTKISQPVYSLLAETDILDQALRMELKGTHTREGLLERIALAYLWGSESLTGLRFTFLFEAACLDYLEIISNFFQSLDSRKLEPEQVDRIIVFFNHAIDWSQSLDKPPPKLLSSLSMIICYIKSIDDKLLKRLKYVTPYLGYNGSRFLEELERLAENYMDEVCKIFRKLSETYLPSYDHEDRLKLFIITMAGYNSDMKIVALRYTDKLANIGTPGMMELHLELKS